jgi:hypothetical protein
MTLDFLKNGRGLIMGIVPITSLEPDKIHISIRKKNWNSRINKTGKLGMVKNVFQYIGEIYISVDPDKK